MILVFMLIAVCGFAEETTVRIDALDNGVETALDLNGDGTDEYVTWRTVTISEYDEISEIRVKDASGAEVGWGSEIMYGSQALLADIDGDGMTEILISGDMMSDDYITYCLHYDGSSLQMLQFADGLRGQNAGGYYDYGYGWVSNIGENALSLIGSQDMLGTYMMNRTYALKDGRFEFADDGLWRANFDESDDDMWEYRALTLTQSVGVTFIDANGASAGTLQAGEKVVVISGDKVSTVYFITQDGREGYFSIEPDVNKGWGSLVNGIPENDLFTMIPYAD